MIKKISLSTLLLAMIVIAGLLFAPFVRAEESTTVQNEDGTAASFYEQKQKRLEELKLEAEKKREELQEQARLKVEEAKKQADAKKLELRQKNCEARSAALTNKIEATSTAAKRHQEKINWFNEKIEAFVTKYNLTVENSTELNKAVTDAAAVSQDAVDALAEYKTVVNCEDVDAATAQIIAYKDLLNSARDALKAYRTATKNWLVAVKTSAEALTADDSTSNSQDATSDESNTANEGATN